MTRKPPSRAIGSVFKVEESLIRKWTSSNGKTVMAEYLGKKDASVLIVREDGKEITVKLVDLSEKDLDWITHQK